MEIGGIKFKVPVKYEETVDLKKKKNSGKTEQ
jgi:hypothetical protein